MSSAVGVLGRRLHQQGEMELGQLWPGRDGQLRQFRVGLEVGPCVRVALAGHQAIPPREGRQPLDVGVRVGLAPSQQIVKRAFGKSGHHAVLVAGGFQAQPSHDLPQVGPLRLVRFLWESLKQGFQAGLEVAIDMTTRHIIGQGVDATNLQDPALAQDRQHDAVLVWQTQAIQQLEFRGATDPPPVPGQEAVAHAQARLLGGPTRQDLVNDPHAAFRIVDADLSGGREFLKKGGERLYSPLDSLLRLTDASGKVLAWNDDNVQKEGQLHRDMGILTHHADSYLSARLPLDGAYFIQLTDARR